MKELGRHITQGRPPLLVTTTRILERRPHGERKDPARLLVLDLERVDIAIDDRVGEFGARIPIVCFEDFDLVRVEDVVRRESRNDLFAEAFLNEDFEVAVVARLDDLVERPGEGRAALLVGSADGRIDPREVLRQRDVVDVIRLVGEFALDARVEIRRFGVEPRGVGVERRLRPMNSSEVETSNSAPQAWPLPTFIGRYSEPSPNAATGTSSIRSVTSR